MKKFYRLLLITSFLLVGCKENIDETVHSYIAKVDIPGISQYKSEGSFVYYDEMFAKYDENTYHNDLAYLACLNNIDEVGIDSETVSNKTTFEQLDFEDVVIDDLKDRAYFEDRLDVAIYSLGHKEFEYEGSKYQVFAVNVYGTKGISHMASNIDIGMNNDTYLSNPNEHAEWIHRENHKGFDVTANRILDLLNGYVNDKKDSDATPIYFVSGHSRGGAVANIISKELTDTKVKTFGYCGASPNTTTDPEAASYKNIFCFTNSDDLVPCFPSENLDFTIYGKRINVSIEENMDIWNEITSTRPYKHMNISLAKEVMSQLGFDRESFYEIPNTKDPKDLLACSTYEYAEILRKEYEKDIAENPILAKYVKLTEIEQLDGGKYGFYLISAPALLLDIVVKIVDEPLNTISIVKTYTPFFGRYMTIFTPFITDIANLDIVARACVPHYAGDYLVILNVIENTLI